MSERTTPAAAVVPKLAYRIDEAVFSTGLSIATLYRDIESGLLKTRKRGRATLILARDLETYLESFPAGSMTYHHLGAESEAPFLQ